MKLLCRLLFLFVRKSLLDNLHYICHATLIQTGLSENWGTLFWGPYKKDPTYYLGYYIRVPYLRKPPKFTGMKRMSQPPTWQ